MKKVIQEKIEEARLRARLKVKPYIIEPTGHGRTKCHADTPDPNCSRCRRRLLMRKRRAEAQTVAEAASEEQIGDLQIAA
jgi:hypothetical protein